MTGPWPASAFAGSSAATLQRRQVLTQVPAASSGNHDRRPDGDHVAENRSPLGDRTSTRDRAHDRACGSRPDRDPARTRAVSLSARQPDSPAMRPLACVDRRPSRAKRGDTGRVIGMAVRHEHARERAAAEPGRDRIDMTGLADAGVDERGLGAVEQPGVVAGAGHGTGVAGVYKHGRHFVSTVVRQVRRVRQLRQVHGTRFRSSSFSSLEAKRKMTRMQLGPVVIVVLLVLRESSFLALVFRKSFHLEAKRRRARGLALSNGFRGGETARVVLFQKSGQERPHQLCENFHNLSIL